MCSITTGGGTVCRKKPQLCGLAPLIMLVLVAGCAIEPNPSPFEFPGGHGAVNDAFGPGPVDAASSADVFHPVPAADVVHAPDIVGIDIHSGDDVSGGDISIPDVPDIEEPDAEEPDTDEPDGEEPDGEEPDGEEASTGEVNVEETDVDDIEASDGLVLDPPEVTGDSL